MPNTYAHLFRIKFRLDEMGDIIWYNDLIHSNFGDDMVTHESAEALFSCETYELIDIMVEGPGLLFGAFAGHNIEFKVVCLYVNTKFFFFFIH